jgi:hypothetical protein
MSQRVIPKEYKGIEVIGAGKYHTLSNLPFCPKSAVDYFLRMGSNRNKYPHDSIGNIGVRFF